MDITQLEAQNFFGANNIVLCPRCGTPCKVSGGGDQEARIAHYADWDAVERRTGKCLECTVTGWLKSIEVIIWGLKEQGLKALLSPNVQKSFTAIVNASMHEDFTPEQINWQRLVDNWDLPEVKPKRQRRKRS